MLRQRSNPHITVCQTQAPLSERSRLNLVGPQIRKLREAQKMTQEDFTARCNIVGLNISRSTLAKIESQVRRVTDEEAALLAKALKVSVDMLFK